MGLLWTDPGFPDLMLTANRLSANNHKKHSQTCKYNFRIRKLAGVCVFLSVCVHRYVSRLNLILYLFLDISAFPHSMFLASGQASFPSPTVPGWLLYRQPRHKHDQVFIPDPPRRDPPTAGDPRPPYPAAALRRITRRRRALQHSSCGRAV